MKSAFVVTVGLSRSEIAQAYWLGVSNSSTPDLLFTEDTGIERMRLTSGGILLLGTTTTTGAAAGQMVFTETAAPTAAGADKAILSSRDNGAGKTQLCATFATGAIQCFATEP